MRTIRCFILKLQIPCEKCPLLLGGKLRSFTGLFFLTSKNSFFIISFWGSSFGFFLFSKNEQSWMKTQEMFLYFTKKGKIGVSSPLIVPQSVFLWCISSAAHCSGTSSYLKKSCFFFPHSNPPESFFFQPIGSLSVATTSSCGGKTRRSQSLLRKVPDFNM